MQQGHGPRRSLATEVPDSRSAVRSEDFWLLKHGLDRWAAMGSQLRRSGCHASHDRVSVNSGRVQPLNRVHTFARSRNLRRDGKRTVETDRRGVVVSEIADDLRCLVLRRTKLKSEAGWLVCLPALEGGEPISARPGEAAA